MFINLENACVTILLNLQWEFRNYCSLVYASEILCKWFKFSLRYAPIHIYVKTPLKQTSYPWRLFDLCSIHRKKANASLVEMSEGMSEL